MPRRPPAPKRPQSFIPAPCPRDSCHESRCRRTQITVAWRRDHPLTPPLLSASCGLLRERHQMWGWGGGYCPRLVLMILRGRDIRLSSTSFSDNLQGSRLDPSSVWIGQEPVLAPVDTPPRIHQPDAAIPTAGVPTIFERHSECPGLLP